MPIEKATVRLAPPPKPKASLRITHIWEGEIASSHYDGQRLYVSFVGPAGKPRLTVHFTPNANALLLAFFLHPGQRVRIDGLVVREGNRGLNVYSPDMTDEEIERRLQDAEHNARRYKRYLGFLEQGHSEEAAKRLVQLTD